MKKINYVSFQKKKNCSKKRLKYKSCVDLKVKKGSVFYRAIFFDLSILFANLLIKFIVIPKEKFYIDELDDTFVGTLEQVKQRAIKRNEDYVRAYEAAKATDSDLFFCKQYQEVGEKGHCGKKCQFYKPRNGKSGCCTYVGQLYEPTSKFVEVKLK